MPETSHDVFLSYNSKDHDIVQQIAVHLVDKAGLKVWLDRWNLVPGEPLMRNIERGLSASGCCAVFTGGHSQGPWQTPELEAALGIQIGIPAFRVVPVLLPGSAGKDDIPPFLALNLWVDLRNGLTNETLYLLECGIRGVPPGRGRDVAVAPPDDAPSPYCEPGRLPTPGGVVGRDSRFYILRRVDVDVLNALTNPGAVVTVRAPRQTGKTSLVLGTMAAIRRDNLGMRVAFVDFQAQSFETFQSLQTVWQAVADYIDEQLRPDSLEPFAWNPNVRYDRNFSSYLKNVVFKSNNSPLLICLDEIDRVLKTPIKSDFFSSLRSLIGLTAWKPEWQQVRWLLSTSSEPNFFIKDFTQSPFNVGLRVDVGAFTDDEVSELARRHGLILERDILQRIMGYLGGRPYLTHLFLWERARNSVAFDRLFDGRSAGGGVFSEHFGWFVPQFQKNGELLKAMHSIIKGDGCRDARLADQIKSAGLARRDENRNLVPFCELYAEFFESELK